VPSESVRADSRDSRSIRRRKWLESTFVQKKNFSAVPRRLTHQSARRQRAQEAVSMCVAAFASQLKRGKKPYSMRISVIVCLLMRD
jgi:hypothetical protein